MATTNMMLLGRTTGMGRGYENFDFEVLLLSTFVRTEHMCRLTKAVKNSHGIFSAALYTITGSQNELSRQ